MERIYSISEITNKIKNILEEGVGYVALEGEVSNFKPHSSGHLYFTLKDANASISAFMFKWKAASLKFLMRDGLVVKAFGNISLYPKRGVYQINVERMEASGEGDILKMLEERKKKLAKEGLFDQSRKKKLPFMPRRVAIITSPTGAAVQDIIRVASERNPKLELIVLPSLVQGEDAATSIITGLKIAMLHDIADVIIVGRGGGSIEDLLPFSDEGVVREIAKSSIPVISSVGHEIDWAISDYVADARAATPTEAAVMVSPILSDVMQKIQKTKDSLLNAIMQRVERLKLLCASFDAEHLELMFRRVEQPLLFRFDDAKESLLRNMQQRLEELKRRNELLRARLISPKDILRRGYAIVTNKKGRAITKAKEVEKGEELKVEVYEGAFDVKAL